jgi:hypothetical protein
MWKRIASLVETRFREEDTGERRKPTPALAQTPVPAPAPPRVAQDFRAVSIAPRADACAAAKQMNGKRHLVREAPRLPLPECASPEQCRCRYEKHDDRRHEDRRHPFGNGLGLADPDAERRQKKSRGRRSTDF